MSELLKFLVSDGNRAPIYSSLHCKIIQSNISLTAHKEKDGSELAGHINRCLNVNKYRTEGLVLLHEFIIQSSSELFSQNALSWSRLLLEILQSHTSEETKGLTCVVMAGILNHTSSFPELSRDVSSAILPCLISCLVSLNEKGVVGGLTCLNRCMTSYSGACGPYKPKIEKYLISLLNGKQDNRIKELASRALALTVRCGGGGSQGIKHTESWGQQLDKVLDSTNSLLDQLYQDCETESGPKSRKESLLSTKISSTEPARIFDLVEQFSTLVNCLIALLSEDFPATVKVPLDDIIAVICRALAITPKVLGATPSQEKRYLSEILPEIHQLSLQVLDSLNTSCGGHVIPYSHVINQLFVQTLKWSVTRLPEYGARKAYSALRQVVYQSICTWVHTVGAASNIEKVATVILESIMSDVKPPQDTIKLKSKQAGKGSDTYQPPKKRRKSHLFAEAGQITGQRKLDTHANSDLCITALKAMQLIIEKSGCFIKPEAHKELHEALIPMLLHIQQDPANIAIPYSAAPCRVELYNLLLLLVMSPHPRWLPPMSCVMSVFSAGQQDPDHQVTSICSRAMLSLENISHPRVPCMQTAVPQANLDMPQTSTQEDDTPDHTTTESLLTTFSSPNFETPGTSGTTSSNMVEDIVVDSIKLKESSDTSSDNNKPLLETAETDMDVAEDVDNVDVDVENVVSEILAQNFTLAELTNVVQLVDVKGKGETTETAIEIADEGNDTEEEIIVDVCGESAEDAKGQVEEVRGQAENNNNDHGETEVKEILEKSSEAVDKMMADFVDVGPDSDEGQ